MVEMSINVGLPLVTLVVPTNSGGAARGRCIPKIGGGMLDAGTIRHKNLKKPDLLYVGRLNREILLPFFAKG